MLDASEIRKARLGGEVVRIVVFGGRDYGDLASLKGDRSHPLWSKRESEYRNICRTLNDLSAEKSIHYNPDHNWLPSDFVVISGCATGADSVALDWAVVNWCQIEEYPAQWDDLTTPPVVLRYRKDGTPYNAAAGGIRNQKMIDVGRPDIGIGFPGQRGTRDMYNRLVKAGIEVRKVGW
jgi:hypothetical protein